jgi:hypothetical protein
MINPKHIYKPTNQPTNKHANNPVGHPTKHQTYKSLVCEERIMAFSFGLYNPANCKTNTIE